MAIIAGGLVLAPWLSLTWAMGLLTIAAWSTVFQRILLVRRQLNAR